MGGWFRTILVRRLGMEIIHFFLDGSVVWMIYRNEIDFVDCLSCLSTSGCRLQICFR